MIVWVICLSSKLISLKSHDHQGNGMAKPKPFIKGWNIPYIEVTVYSDTEMGAEREKHCTQGIEQGACTYLGLVPNTYRIKLHLHIQSIPTQKWPIKLTTHPHPISRHPFSSHRKHPRAFCILEEHLDDVPVTNDACGRHNITRVIKH